MFIWYLSTFIVYISYQRAAMNDSGSGYQGATGMLDAEAEGWFFFRCHASNLWFRHELKIPLGWGIIMDYWRSIGSYVLYLLSQIE